MCATFHLFQELDVRTVLNALHKAEFSDGDWFQLGQQLITNAALRTIRTHHFDAGNCMIDTISQWLRTDLEASWEKLAEAITKVGGYGEATAKVVRQKTGIGKVENYTSRYSNIAYIGRKRFRMTVKYWNGRSPVTARN